ncbi:MAG: glycosyltransferase [Chromatiaceae bacterium]|nr:glycosyltransferase [Chromatiaceae bacterium]
MSNAQPIIAPSLVAQLNERRHRRHPQAAAAADADTLLQLAQLQPATASYALIESARIAFDQNQPQAAFLGFLTAYVHHPEPDPRLLDWMARAARTQDQHPAADQLERLAKRERAAPPADAQTQVAAEQISPPKLIARKHRSSIDVTKGFRARESGQILLQAPTRDPRTEPVEIIIPVYRGHQETLACIHSVLKAQSANRAAHQILVLDDASPDRDLIAAIKQLTTQHAGLSIVHHPVNLGFIRGVNRAMARQPNRDVIWLNADTRVLGDWVDRLQTWAYSAPKVASVTPFSNHGELMTFPNPRYRYPMPSHEQHAALDLHARRCQPSSTPVSLPVGCGFCLYVRREAIADVGYLDEDQLAGGYGEDTDWCLRAASRGWTHLAATNLFVVHHGSLSFGDEKTWRVARNNAVIRKRFPNAERQFDHFVARNPLTTARDQLQRARLAELAAWVHNALGPEPPLGSPHPHPRHLHRLGPRGIADPRSLFFAPLPDAPSTPRTAPPGLLSISLRNLGRGPEILLSAALPGLPLELTYRLDEELDRLENDLQQLPLQGLVQHGPNQIPDALSERLQRLQLKSASIQLPTHKQPLGQAHPAQQTPEPQTAYLIADSLHDPQVQRAWLSLARTCALQPAAPWLLVLDDNAWLPELMAMGRVLHIRELPGLDLGTLLNLAGCQAALTLNPVDSAATTLASTLANRLDLPLCSVTTQVSAARDLEFVTMIKPMRQKLQMNGAQDTTTSMKDGTPRDGTSTDESSNHETAPQPASQKTFLNIGCGNMSANRLPPLFRTGNWREIRLDIDPTVNADIVTDSADLSALDDASVAAAYSSHTLEHLEPHQVPIALREIHRVLEADGFALITLPDIQAVAQLVVDGKLTETAYESPVGPITALDMLYGHRDSLARGNHYMAHQTGFDSQHLGESLLAAGFAEVRIRKGRCFDLWAFAFKQKLKSEPPWLAFPLADTANAT